MKNVREVLDIERWRENCEALDCIDAKLRNMAAYETHWMKAQLLTSMANEASRIADLYSEKIKAHDKLKADLTASVESGE